MSKIDTYFPKVRMLFYLSNFHTASRAPCSCHSVSSWDRSSNFGALVLWWWGSPGQIIPTEGFWSRMSAWRATACVNFTRWIGFRMSELFREIDDNFGASMSWNTQPNCCVFDDPHPTSPWFNSWQVSRFTTYCQVLSCKSCFFQHGYCTFVMILCGPFTSLFFNLTMCIRTLFPKCASTLGLVVCWRRILQQTPSPWRECTTDLPLNWPRWSWRVERTAWGCWGMREGKWKWCKRSKKSERTLNSCMHDDHEMDWGHTQTSWANVQCARDECDNTKLTAKTATLHARVHDHFVLWLILWNLVFTLSLVSDTSTSSNMALFINCFLQCIRNAKFCPSGCCSPIVSCHRPLNLYPKFLHLSHRENGWFEVLSSHHPSFAAHRRQL